MRKPLCLSMVVGALLLTASLWGESSRIKDVARFQGVRENMLIGYGLVVGLDGTGDSRQTFFTTQTLTNLLNRQGITVPARSIQVTNTAAVMVTASLPAFARTGSRIDVTASSIGDADSLQGGMLLMTELAARDGRPYVLAQGAVSIGGFSAKTATSSVQKNQPTVGRVPGGGTVEQEVDFSLQGRAVLNLVLNEGDFTTASRLADVINREVVTGIARPLDSKAVEVKVPEKYRSDIVPFIATIENQTLEVDRIAKIVLNEKTGTIIFGKEVRISAVAIVHGALAVQIGTQFAISQPSPFSGGETAVVPNQTVEVTEEPAKQMIIEDGATIDEVVRALNAIGATPRDIFAIIQAVKAAGAMQATLEII